MGVMAAAGLVGLETAAERMALDHQRAKEIASAVETAGSSYVTASLSATQTNIVFLHSKCVSAEKLSSRLARVRFTLQALTVEQNQLKIEAICMMDDNKSTRCINTLVKRCVWFSQKFCLCWAR
jgi:threonine aldolase